MTSPIQSPSRPIRVCFLIDNLSLAGTESQLLMLLRGLDRARIDPHLVLLDGTRTASRSLEPHDCPVLRLGLKSFFRPAFVRKLWQFVRFLRSKQIDVLQLHFRDSTYFGVLAGKLAGVKRIILTRRNIGHWMTARDRFLMRICQKFAHATIANCEACRKAAIGQEGANLDSVHVIHNAIDLSRFANIPPYQPKINGEILRVGVVANLRPVKGIDVFIRAAALVTAEFPNIEFPIVGNGNPTLYRKLAEECGVSEKIRFLGPVEDIPTFLAGLDVAVLPSRAEGLSNSLLEYMAAGRPIVATDVGGNREVIENKSDGLLVPAENGEKLSCAILTCIRDTNTLSIFGLAVQTKAAAIFSQKVIAQDYEKLIEKILIEQGTNAS